MAFSPLGHVSGRMLQLDHRDGIWEKETQASVPPRLVWHRLKPADPPVRRVSESLLASALALVSIAVPNGSVALSTVRAALICGGLHGVSHFMSATEQHAHAPGHMWRSAAEGVVLASVANIAYAFLSTIVGRVRPAGCVELLARSVLRGSIAWMVKVLVEPQLRTLMKCSADEMALTKHPEPLKVLMASLVSSLVVGVSAKVVQQLSAGLTRSRGALSGWSALAVHVFMGAMTGLAIALADNRLQWAWSRFGEGSQPAKNVLGDETGRLMFFSAVISLLEGANAIYMGDRGSSVATLMGCDHQEGGGSSAILSIPDNRAYQMPRHSLKETVKHQMHRFSRGLQSFGGWKNVHAYHENEHGRLSPSAHRMVRVSEKNPRKVVR